MNDPLFNIALLIIVVCNLGILGLYWRIYQWMQTPAEIYSVLCDIQEKLNKFARDTDYDFRVIKTRMTDEERDDQRAKRRARRQGR